MMGRIKTIFVKEVVDNLRDKRSMSGALAFPLLGPIITAATILLLGKVQTERADRFVTLPVVGAAHAPGLITFLDQHHIKTEVFTGDAESAIRQDKHDVILIVPSSFGEQFRGARPATVRLVMDTSRSSARHSISRVRRLLAAYGRQIGRLRLMARGVDPSISQAIAIERRDVSTPESRAAMLMAMLPYFIIIAIFLGGMYIAIDSTAGELERGSLEPLFINPVKRWEFVAGKFLATLFFGSVGLIIAMIGFWLIPNFVSTEGLGAQIRLDPAVLGKIVLLVLPLTALASAMQMLVATFSKGFKEAQTQLSFLMILPVVPGLFLALAPFKAKVWMMAIPILSEQILINKLIRAEVLDPVFVGLCCASTTLAAAISLLVATRLYGGERVFVRR